MRRHLLVVLTVVALATGVGMFVVAGASEYKVRVMLANATNLTEGGAVQVGGFDAGSIERIDVRDGRAELTLSLDREHTPLHSGAQVTVNWKAVLGERLVTIKDGSEKNAAVPDGGMLQGKMPEPMEFDQVFAALDKPTRKNLKSLINRLGGTVQGNEKDINETLSTAGPAVDALGSVLRAVGTDGPAIKQLIDQLDGIVGTLADRQQQIRTIVKQVSKTASLTARQRNQLSAALDKLPDTMRTAKKTLGDIPEVADKAAPLLDKLKPATDKLPSVAGKLEPVLKDLRPLVGELRPTLGSAKQLLKHTPGLLDSAHATFPGINTLVSDLHPALRFLRPFTPEAAGVFANWGSAHANYDSNGHYARIYIQAGAGNVNVNPGVMPPGYSKDETPLPGQAGGQPWKDAFGSGVR